MTQRMVRKIVACLFAIVILPASVLCAQEVETTAQYLRRLKLGAKVTVMVVFSAENPESLKNEDFYKRIAALTEMDRRNGRFIVLTRDGVIPAETALKERGIKAHGLGSFPGDPAGLPTAMGSVVVLDANGAVVRRWDGFPSATQQDEVVALLRKLSK